MPDEGHGLEDRTLQCSDCGKDFVFTAAEQEFFRERGFEHAPKRCVECRRQRRRKFRGRGGSEGGGDGERAEGRPRTAEPARAPRPRRSPPAAEHDAVCSACGAATKVPFVPDGVRPVFCMPCLKQQTR